MVEFEPQIEPQDEQPIDAAVLAAAATVAQVVYDNRALRWRNVTTGRFIADAVVTSEMERHVTATFDTLEGLTRQLYAREINLTQWQTAVASELKDAHLAQAMFARGGKANMTAAEYGRVGATLRDEYQFLAGFADDIANDAVSEAQAIARIRQYGRATRQSYWREYGLASPELIYWKRSPAESCSDCISLEAGSPYTADTLPTVPGAGSTACRGNCKCTLERRRA